MAERELHLAIFGSRYILLRSHPLSSLCELLLTWNELADDSPLIAENVEAISVVEATGSAADVLYLENVVLDIHAYKLHPEAATSPGASQGSEDGDHDEQPSSKVTILPSKTLDGLWEL